jgi:ribosome biogenesis GTPase
LHYSDNIYVLEQYGWNSRFAENFEPYRCQGLLPARVVRDGRELYRGIHPGGEAALTLSGSFRYLLDLGVQPMPVIGDWCAVSPTDDPAHFRIEGVLPRSTVLHRRSCGDEDLSAANVDVIGIVSSIAKGLNLRRIERFLANAQSGGAQGALILTKIDLVDEPEAYKRRAAARFGELPIYLVDSISGAGAGDLNDLFLPGRSIALTGISGAGKSTLINLLLGSSRARTAAVRDSDGRGRHTTTERVLFRIPSGALVIDTPGVRSVGITGSEASTEASFDDIARLAEACRFSDCTHRNEPGCAVRKALLAGEIEQDRYLNYLQLLHEASAGEVDERERRREKDRRFGRLRYTMRKEGRRGGGFDGR